MPLTDLISFEGVLMSGFSRKGEQMLKFFKQAYKCCCFHFTDIPGKQRPSVRQNASY